MNIKRFLQNHPIASYFILAYLISWGGSILTIGPKFLRGETIQLTDNPLIFLPMLAGPSLAGILLTGIVDGRDGLRDLFARMAPGRVRGRWLATPLIFPALILATLLLLSWLVSPDFAPAFFGFGIIPGLFAGFFEEIGWMGYVYPKMQAKYNALTAAILLGVIHGIWHLLAGYLGASVTQGAYWWPHFLAFVAGMTAVRIVMAWTYTHTRSVFLAQLLHASSTGFLAILVPLSLSPANNTLFYGVYAAVLWGVAAVIAVRSGKRLARQPLPVLQIQ